MSANQDPAAGQAMAVLGLGQYEVEKVTTGTVMKSDDFSVLFGDGNLEDSEGNTVDHGEIGIDDENKAIYVRSMADYNQLLTILLASRGEAEAYFNRH